MRTAILWVVFVAVAATVAVAGDVLVVVNKSADSASLVDPSTLEVLATLPTGHGPHEAAASPDGRTVFVTDYGTGDEPGSSITVLDVRERRVVATYDLGDFRRPHGIEVSSDGTRVWVTCEGSQAVVELNAESGEIVDSWKTEQKISHMLALTADEKTIFVANIGSGSATVIDRESGKVRSISTGAGAEGIAVTPDGSKVWVTNRGADTLSILDASDGKILRELGSEGSFPIRVEFTPDGRLAWISNARSNAIAVFDTGTMNLVGTVEVGAMPIGILISPDGKRAFVANTMDDRVTVIDVGERKVVGTFETGKEPDGMAWVSPRG
jgi:YVTN family beta-propeller protein